MLKLFLLKIEDVKLEVSEPTLVCRILGIIGGQNSEGLATEARFIILAAAPTFFCDPRSSS